jgi:hypothetical protein
VEYLNGGEVLEVTVRVRDGEFVSERVRRVDTQLAVQVSGQQAIAVHAADDTSMTPSTRKASQPENKNKELLQPTSHTHGKNRRKKNAVHEDAKTCASICLTNISKLTILI